jgi:hypothetical protein
MLRGQLDAMRRRGCSYANLLEKEKDLSGDFRFDMK